MATWLSQEDMVTLRASVLKDVNFEAEDLITNEVFSPILWNQKGVMRLLFEIPDAYDHEAFCELGSFLLQYATTSNSFFVYILGDAERLLKLIAPLALRGVSVLPD